MTGHTPGPWRAGILPGSIVADPPPEFAGSHADTYVYFGGYVIAQNIAPQNRAVMVAAPDLLAVVQKLAEWNRKYPSSRIYGEAQIREIAAENDAINAAGLAAIAKATQP